MKADAAKTVLTVALFVFERYVSAAGYGLTVPRPPIRGQTVDKCRPDYWLGLAL